MILRDKDKKLILEIAKETLPKDSQIWAYGSRVNGTAHSGSDLDLVVRAKDLEKLDIDEFVFFKEKMQKSNIPILVQILDWARVPKYFHKNILKNYEILK